ncbi:hypothetical protein Q3A80_01490 [Burkholderia sp. SR8]
MKKARYQRAFLLLSAHQMIDSNTNDGRCIDEEDGTGKLVPVQPANSR